uniref:alpha/beta fold hydrolase n=1 Tax=Paractinoplanes polyasparticus TaxID=2856853 RepID=UPI001C863BE7|nr:alpha/beta fold hydrolase [Actinoplanes polyasparticus]
MVTDQTINAGEVPLRYRDYGGSGHPLVLLHGAGADRTSWDAVGPPLAESYRTVAVDLRGHGESGDGLWSWEEVLDDLEAVVAALGMARPAMVGHSVGGLLAARWTRRHLDCPAAASLDGHRVAGTQTSDLGTDTDDDVVALSDGFTAWFDAAFAQHESRLRSAQAAASAAARAAIAADNFTSLQGLSVPFLMVVAESSGPHVPAEWEPLTAAFRAGLWRDLHALAGAQPSIELRPIDASHGMLYEAPQETVGIVADFLGRTLATSH